MTEPPFSILYKKTCDKRFTMTQIHNEECERWNKSQRGCSTCPEFKERTMIGYEAILTKSIDSDTKRNIRSEENEKDE